MTRDSRRDLEYWDSRIESASRWIPKIKEQIASHGDHPGPFTPQYAFDLAQEYMQLILSMYSRGDELSSEGPPLLEQMLDAWALSNEMYSTRGVDPFARFQWSENLDFYIMSFWTVGLALAWDVSDATWQRLIDLVGNEGNDVLLDRVIATRTGDRSIGQVLCHPRPYQQLLASLDAPIAQQGTCLRSFVDDWYTGLNQESSGGNHSLYLRPYWHALGDKDPSHGGYFGCWCVEAVAVVKAFNLDDSLCIGHPNYPSDLVHRSMANTDAHVGAIPHPRSGVVWENIKRMIWRVR